MTDSNASEKDNASGFLFEATLILAICSFFGLFSGFFWFFDLFNHFRPQATLAGLLLLLLALLFKDRKSMKLLMVILLLNLGLMAERLHAFPSTLRVPQASDAATQDVSVMFANVLISNQDNQSLIDMVAGQKPDILILAEIDEYWAKGLETLKTDYPFTLVIPRPDNFGMAIYSKRPFTHELFEVGDYALPLLMLDLDTFALVAVHPIPPTSQQNTRELQLYTQKTADAVKSTLKPVLLVGDLNTTLWSQHAGYYKGLGLQRTSPWGVAWTWPREFAPLAVQIDHIFVRGALAADWTVLPSIGSDHFPIISRIKLPAGEPL